MSKPSLDRFFGPGGLLASVIGGYEDRPQQIHMARAVAEALERRSVLLAEAGTGTGKTWAYLVPALLSGRRVVISTATKNLQEQIVQKDLPVLLGVLKDKVRVCLMKGRANYLCLHRLEQQKVTPAFRTSTDRARLADVVRWAGETDTGDRSELDGIPDDSDLWRELSVNAEQCLGSSCDSFDECFMTRLRRRALDADLIVVNHHLYFADLSVRERAYGEILPYHDAVILDEGHEVPDIAGDYFGRRVSQFRLAELARDIARETASSKLIDAELSRAAERLLSGSRALFDALSRFLGDDSVWGSGIARRVRLPPAAETGGLDEEVLAALTEIEERARTLAEQGPGIASLAERSRTLSEEMRFLLERADPKYVYWCEFREGRASLSASPIDVSSLLADTLFVPDRAVIVTSATLSTSGTMEYMSRRLGVPDAAQILFDSPFDYGRQALLYLPPGMPEPSGPSFFDAAAEEIRRILEVTRGRAFVLFSSFRHLDELHARLTGAVPYRLLRQGDEPKSALLRQFRENIGSVLLATSSFWQGVDVEGEALSCVIVDKLPFAVPTDPVVAARSEAYRMRGEDPFLSYHIPEAIISLKQGLGRLIRSRSDRGVLVVLDRRITQRPYGKAFLKSLPPCPVTSSLDDVKAFFDPSRLSGSRSRETAGPAEKRNTRRASGDSRRDIPV